MSDIDNNTFILLIGGLLVFVIGLFLKDNPTFSVLWLLGEFMYIAGIAMIFVGMGYHCGIEAIKNE